MSAENKQEQQIDKEHISMSQALDDEQRVKVLSPSALVIKRFFRNKLAMVGLFIIITMFLFSFLGGIITPYEESQVFRKTDYQQKDYAGVSENQDYLYTSVEGKEFPSIAGAKFILAVNNGEESFEVKGITYHLVPEAENFYRIVELTEVGTAMNLKGKSTFNQTGEVKLTEAMKSAYAEAAAAEKNVFEAEGKEYVIAKSGKLNSISTAEEIAVASKMIFSPYSKDVILSYPFHLEAQRALTSQQSSFTADGNTYQIEVAADKSAATVLLDEEEYARVSRYAVRPVSGTSFLPISFQSKAEESIIAGETSFFYTDEKGTEAEYFIERTNMQYMIRAEQKTLLNDMYSAPSGTHWLGTDGRGMDVLTRLMYGGRISLMIGFVAIAIEILIGVIVGGIAGYFGKWADTILMRVVDTVNCIPAMPLYIILGAVMDYYQIDPRIRIYMLCGIIGLLSWASIARMVRGQILSLREQEFMIAAEATGIRVSRRIFKHLIPNVIPQLIVIATMGLGEIILMEATLSFLGLGVKLPYASWGNIINAVNDIYVMTNYWFVWIPAGFLILITVLGFNFVGDGLRDAFDPKMKR